MATELDAAVITWLGIGIDPNQRRLIDLDPRHQRLVDLGHDLHVPQVGNAHQLLALADRLALGHDRLPAAEPKKLDSGT